MEATMGAVQEAFLRRYATTPIHVPRLERLLATYGPCGTEDAFAQEFIQWDDACSDGDAARIVTEVISQLVDRNGQLVRLTDEAVRGAMKPTDEQVAWAKRVIDATASNAGAVKVDGKMVDKPVILKAERILAASQA